MINFYNLVAPNVIVSETHELQRRNWALVGLKRCSVPVVNTFCCMKVLNGCASVCRNHACGLLDPYRRTDEGIRSLLNSGHANAAGRDTIGFNSGMGRERTNLTESGKRCLKLLCQSF